MFRQVTNDVLPLGLSQQFARGVDEFGQCCNGQHDYDANPLGRIVSRLCACWPALTQAVSKQLMPVYDKPMIYYPLSTLMLGDNIFYGHDLVKQFASASARTTGASVFAYHVHDPERYGVGAFDAQQQAVSIEEKPLNPKSNYAVTGLYFDNEQVCDIAASIVPSARGELEITDVNRHYLEQGQLNVEIMGRGFAWLDTGTHDSLLDAASFTSTLQKRQGLRLSCPEEIAYGQKWINTEQLQKLAAPLAKNGYGRYLLGLSK